MKNNRRFLCFDIGGTAIKAGVLSEAGEILETERAATPRSGNPDALLSVLESLANGFSAGPFAGTCVATTGIVDPFRGVILPCRGFLIDKDEEIPLKSLLSDRLGLPVEIENDVSCVALAENWLGAARGFRNAVCITVGTGIGGAFLIDGKLYRGTRFDAMEVGHMPFGSAGWEQLASTRALVADYAESAGIAPEATDGRTIAERAREGEENAIRALDKMCALLAQGIASLLCVLSPDVFVFGGGIAGSMELLQPRIDAHLKRMLHPRFREPVAFREAALGNDAGMVGALRHFLMMNEKEGYAI